MTPTNTMPVNKKCNRCGNCCIDVGRTFWKGGDFSDCPVLDKWAKNGDHEDGSKPCEMLRFENGLAVCGIEADYGLKYKPVVCKEHQGDERCVSVFHDHYHGTAPLEMRRADVKLLLEWSREDGETQND